MSLLCVTHSVINGQFLQHHAYMVWGVKDPLSQLKYSLRFSPSHLRYHISVMI